MCPALCANTCLCCGMHAQVQVTTLVPPVTIINMVFNITLPASKTTSDDLLQNITTPKFGKEFMSAMQGRGFSGDLMSAPLVVLPSPTPPPPSAPRGSLQEQAVANTAFSAATFTRCNYGSDALSVAAIADSWARMKACHAQNPTDPTECTAQETRTMLARYPQIAATRAACIADGNSVSPADYPGELATRFLLPPLSGYWRFFSFRILNKLDAHHAFPISCLPVCRQDGSYILTHQLDLHGARMDHILTNSISLALPS